MPALSPEILAQCPDPAEYLLCSSHQGWEPDEAFGHSRHAPTHRFRQYVCKPCNSKAAKARRHLARDYDFQRKYGIDQKQRDAMVAEQDGKCYTCGKPEAESRHGQLCVDHCHDTGTVRRMLCNVCNLAMGMLNDDPATLLRMADMIAEFKSEVVTR